MKFLPLLILSTAAGSAFARGGGDGNGTDDYDPEMVMDMDMNTDTDPSMSWGGGRGGRGGGGRWRNSTRTGDDPKSQCRNLARLTSLSALASDPTKLAEIISDIESKGDPEKAATFQAQVSQAAGQLATLQSDTPTLMETCASILAEMEMRQSCRTLARLEKLASLVVDPDKLAEKTRDDTDKAERIKSKVEESAEMLASLQGNATLTQFCSVLDLQDSCRDLRRLERFVGLSENGGNATMASGWGGRQGGGGRKNRHRGGGGRNETTDATETEGYGEQSDESDEERARKWQAELAEKKAELEKLKSNATLVDLCAAMESSDGTGTSGGSSSSGDGASYDSTTDDGVVIAGASGGLLQPFGTMAMSLATVFLFGLLVL